MRRFVLHGFLLFALLFQSLAHAMPCCDMMGALPVESVSSMADHSMAESANDASCFTGSPVCCVIPSVAQGDLSLLALTMKAVRVATVQPLALAFESDSPERPPRA
ncbi:MAG TPA: hypothetical protein VFV43_01955 [Limnobacter sp.]|nr:hypothetical protein [Limnobacter sp.]